MTDLLPRLCKLPFEEFVFPVNLLDPKKRRVQLFLKVQGFDLKTRRFRQNSLPASYASTAPLIAFLIVSTAAGAFDPSAKDRHFSSTARQWGHSARSGSRPTRLS